jgi:photosystem II stability/assembly factor-like uncharacterized protein
MPLHFSPIHKDLLFYVSNAVWKSPDRGQSWTRISPDLTRKNWNVPTNAGQYAAAVKPAPAGAITALALSSRDVRVLWAGTDDGYVQVTTDGGVRWTNVTPSAIKPWTRIFNIDAGRHDARTAYVAANTLRLDELVPRFYRTHDAGATWTDISAGLPPDAVANSIREDPRVKGLLYAATDHQVWLSVDDGATWSSLKQNMPTISVRDLEVKDDSSCLCSDLIAGTHGRGFWILDNVTPLRQLAAARAARSAGKPLLFAPSRAVRVRFGTNDPTPWPPEVPGGENPLPGALIDYLLPSAAQQVTLEIVDAAGRMVRRMMSTTPVVSPHPATDRVAYDAICRDKPSAPYCGLPLYWPAPPMPVSTRAGMHRVSWDLHFDPVSPEDEVVTGNVDATGAVPGRTYPGATAPWAVPGMYRVRLLVDGQRVGEQSITVHLDPRVKTPTVALQQLHTLTSESYRGAVDAWRAYEAARSVVTQLAGATEEGAALRADLEAIAPASTQPRSIAAIRRRTVPATGAATLDIASHVQLAAALSMHDADVAPTARQRTAVRNAQRYAADAMARWRTLSTTRLAAINAARRTAGQSTITLP